MSTAVEQIKERLDIVDVISGYIKVEKAGINFKARCPFHNEKTPSFFISPARQSFYCFGCGEKGDIFSFVQKFEGVDFRTALESLAERAGVELPKFQGKDESNKDEKERLFEIMEIATKFYENLLAENKSSLEYLRNRGLSQPSILKWRLGLAKAEWRELHNYLLEKGFSKEEMLATGLIKKAAGTEGNRSIEKYYDTFRDRIMFPISDNSGRVIAFSGRSLKEDDKTPKYLNSPETKLFYKSEVLYGFHIAKNHIRKLDYTIFVEGQMDLLMSHQAGVLNTVASSGTALTELHLQKVKKLSNRAIIAYDSDSSGEKAALRAAELALSLGMEVKMAEMEKGEDPASTVKSDPEKWKKCIKESQHFIDFALNKAVRENQGRNLAKEIAKSVLPLVALLGSEMEKSHFIKKIALKVRAPEEAVWSDFKKIETRPPMRQGLKIEGGNKEGKERETNLERIAVGLIFLEESRDKNSNELRSKLQKIMGSKAESVLEDYEKEKEALIFETERYCTKSDAKKTGEDIISRIELQILKDKLREIAITLDDKDLSKEEEEENRKELKRIQKRIKELS